MRIIVAGDDVLEVSSENSNSMIDLIVHNEKLTASFYSNLILELRKCGSEYGMFAFYNLVEYTEYDFGYFKDSEIIWNNFTNID